MRATALIPLVFLSITCSATAGPASYQKYPTTPPETHFQGTCVSDPDGTKFAEKACYTDFDPGRSGFAPRYRPPSCDKSAQVDQAHKDMLAKALSTDTVVCESISVMGPYGLGFLGGAGPAAR